MTFSIPHPERSPAHMVGAQKEQRLCARLEGLLLHPLLLLKFLSCRLLYQLLLSSEALLGAFSRRATCWGHLLWTTWQGAQQHRQKALFIKDFLGLTHPCASGYGLSTCSPPLSLRSWEFRFGCHLLGDYSWFCGSLYCSFFLCVGDSADTSSFI